MTNPSTLPLDRLSELIPVRGRKLDQRLFELDELAANDVRSSKYANAREAAKAYLARYAGHDDFDDQVRNNKLRDIAARIAERLTRTK